MYLAIIVAAVIAMVVGMLWYGPLFGKQWMKVTGMTKADMEGEGQTTSIIIGFINQVVMQWVLYGFIGMFSDGTMMGAITMAFWAWLGFILTQQVSGTIRSKNPNISIVLINGLYRLIAVLIGAVVFTMM